MPTAPPRPCRRCGRIRCTQHVRASSARAQGYSRTWDLYSRDWLRRYPWCGQRQDGLLYADDSRCVQQGLRVKATCTDHILAMKDGGEPFDPVNHQSLCAGCNARKGIAWEGGFGR